jgi:predicted DNA-binding transcriptional regulator AlpA
MTTTPSVPTTWLRVPAAAAHLGLGVSTLNKLRLTGGGPRFAKLTSVVVYDLADLDRWARERKVRSTSEPVGAA